MTEYIDKNKALNLNFKINVSLFESRRETAERAVQAYADAIEAIPAADVRPVVLCRDCVYYIRGKLFGDMVCDYHYLRQYHAEPNEYCSRGEKREES